MRYRCPICDFVLSEGGHASPCLGKCGRCGTLVRFVDFEKGWQFVDGSHTRENYQKYLPKAKPKGQEAQ